ncbi:MAG TPA: hypothetical protein VN641_10355 [Urbifossiella sp.]|nr:hypothetical protein [Urbifossiella sp.]
MSLTSLSSSSSSYFLPLVFFFLSLVLIAGKPCSLRMDNKDEAKGKKKKKAK